MTPTPTDTEKALGVKLTAEPSVKDSSVPIMSSYIATSSLSPYRQELARTISSHYNSSSASASTAPKSTKESELPLPLPSGSGTKVCAMRIMNKLTSLHFMNYTI